MNLHPTTRLEAVNTLLSSVGDAPLSSLTGATSINAVTAQNILHEVNREVQSRGWHFNTEIDYRILPDVDKHLYLPRNTLRVDTIKDDENRDLVQRGNRLYDRRNHTYKFDNGVVTELVIFLDFEELPEPARHYVTIRAGRIFQDRDLSSQILHQFQEADEYWALATLKEFEGDTADYNFLTGNYDVYRVLVRQTQEAAT